MKTAIFVLFAILLTFFGCAKPQVSHSRAVVATIKTPQTAISQSGFIDAIPGDQYRLQIYAAGQGLEELTVGDGICKGLLCMSAARFNEQYLSRNYPPNLLRDILAGRAIANLRGGSTKSIENGFIQRAKVAGKYDITYKKEGAAQSFRDPPNKIKILIRGME